MKYFLCFFSIFSLMAQAQYIPQVKIGQQVWMTKNLDVDTFRNGDKVIIAESQEEYEFCKKHGLPFSIAPDAGSSFCGNDGMTGPSNDYWLASAKRNKVLYGMYYNEYAIRDPRGLCPVGWRVPNDSDWVELIDFLGGEEIAGVKMKSVKGWPEIDEASWDPRAPDLPPREKRAGTNSSGFSALPGGMMGTGDGPTGGPGDGTGKYGIWWSSTLIVDATTGNTRTSSFYIYYAEGGIYNSTHSECSVRCIKD